MFHIVASKFIKAGIWFCAQYQPIFVWLVSVEQVVTVVTVVTQVSVQVTAVVLQDKRVALISQFVQNVFARPPSLETYSSIVSRTYLRVQSGW